jgi:hypothetical protein
MVKNKDEIISLEDQTLLFRAYNRLKVFLKAFPEWVDGLKPQKYIMSNDFIIDVVNPTLYET